MDKIVSATFPTYQENFGISGINGTYHGLLQLGGVPLDLIKYDYNDQIFSPHPLHNPMSSQSTGVFPMMSQLNRFHSMTSLTSTVQPMTLQMDHIAPPLSKITTQPITSSFANMSHPKTPKNQPGVDITSIYNVLSSNCHFTSTPKPGHEHVLPVTTPEPETPKRRKCFHEEQYRVLRRFFEQNQYLESSVVNDIVLESGLTKHQVKRWFRNERHRFYRQNRKLEEIPAPNV